MEPNTKLMEKSTSFVWTHKYQTMWENIRIQYTKAPTLVNSNWDLEFHIYTNASQLLCKIC
jgi:hypothetical protein